MGIGDTYKYLGAKVGVEGFQETPLETLRALIGNVTKAPLKPQQQLYILREHLIPKIQHQ